MSPVFDLILAGFLAWLVTWGLVLYGRRHLMDIPNERSSHQRPVPRGGGASVVLVVIAAWAGSAWHTPNMAYFYAWIILAAGSVAVVGFVDDHRPLPSTLRLCVHLLASVVLTAVLIERAYAFDAVIRFDWWLIGPIAIAMAFVLNAFNFMDGIDWIAAAQTIFVAASAALLTGSDQELAGLWVLVGATTGFAVWNKPPARIFLGDVGSGFIGVTLAVYWVEASLRDISNAFIWAILMSVFLMDTIVTLSTRILTGQRWMTAHRSHAYQILALRWDSHFRVVVMLTAINVFWLLPLAYLVQQFPWLAWYALGAAWLPLAWLAFWVGAGQAKLAPK